jgi:hypothetical protein
LRTGASDHRLLAAGHANELHRPIRVLEYFDIAMNWPSMRLRFCSFEGWPGMVDQAQRPPVLRQNLGRAQAVDLSVLIRPQS